MKIILLSDEYPPILGGAGIVAKQIERTSIKSGDKINIYCPAISNKKIFKIFWPFSYVSFNLIMDIYKSDLIIVNDVRSAYILSILSFILPIDLNKVVYILHGTEYYVAYKSSIKNKILFFGFFYNKFLSRIKKIISVSEYTKNIFLQNTTCNISLKNKINRSYAGLDDAFFSFPKINPNIKKSTFDLVSVSRIEERKGYREMLDIFKKLLKYKKNIRWYIYGDGAFLPKLKELVIEYGLSDKVFFKGIMERYNIYSYEFIKYNYDLFWLLPKEPEAFGLVFIESAIIGVPTLGVNKYGIRESISGLFYEDNEKLLELINNIEFNKKYYTDNAIFFSSKFSSEIFYQEIVK